VSTSSAVSAGSPLATITSLPARRMRNPPPRRAAKRQRTSPEWRSIAARCRAPSLTISIRGSPGALTTAPDALVPTRGASCADQIGSPPSRSWSVSAPSGSSRARPRGVITDTAREQARRQSGDPVWASMQETSRVEPITSRSPQRNVARRSMAGTAAVQRLVKRSRVRPKASEAREAPRRVASAKAR
jgi:hypothetical protein